MRNNNLRTWNDLLRHSTFEAVMFDMDGTLVDNEAQTAEAIREVLHAHDVPNAALPTSLTSGRSWASICESLHDKYPSAHHIEGLEYFLMDSWNRLVEKNATEIPGAIEAVKRVAEAVPVGVVSSSPRFLIDKLLKAIHVDELVPLDHRIGSDNVSRYKPDPEGFLLCAGRLQVSPKRCLVFEDSIAGVRAAKAAGATCVVIQHACNDLEACCRIADAVIPSFDAVSAREWQRLFRSSTLVSSP